MLEVVPGEGHRLVFRSSTALEIQFALLEIVRIPLNLNILR